MSEFNELNEILSQEKNSKPKKAFSEGGVVLSSEEAHDAWLDQEYEQWTTYNDRIFLPAGKTLKKLIPGVYEIGTNPHSGLFFERISVKTEGLLRFPDTNSDTVIAEIQKFWSKEVEEKFREHDLAYKRGIILWGPPGCHAPGTKILMYDGSVKNVEDVVVGDLLMGPDSKPRKVLELKQGTDNMYEVIPNKGESFIVNGHHVLNLHAWKNAFNVTLNQYMSMSKCTQRCLKLHRKQGISTGINSIIPLGKGQYYGFTLNKDHLYLTSDFIVHHNSGKSCTLQLIMADVIERGGVVVKFDEPFLFIDGMRYFRRIQPETPVVVIMEDIDSIIETFPESDVLNILDGVDDIQRTIFLATTNYPGKLGARIINRPSRFDKRFKIDYPSSVARKMYFEHIMTKEEKAKIDLEKWVKDTRKMSIAHLKELFINVLILCNPYEEAIHILRNMKEDIDEREYDGSMGFVRMEGED